MSSKKLEQLQQETRQARQTEITTELLDLITGVKALLGRLIPNPVDCITGSPPTRLGFSPEGRGERENSRCG